MHQAHAVATVLYAHLMREGSLQRGRLNHIMDKLADIVDSLFGSAAMLLFGKKIAVMIAHENHAAGRWAYYIIIILKQIVETVSHFFRFILKTSVCHRLSAAGLV